MALNISLQEALSHYVQAAKEWALSPIPNVERLEIILNRMRQDVAEKRMAKQEALSAVVAIQDPEDPTRGKLPALQARLIKYQDKGAEWGAQYKELRETQHKRRADLMSKMREASANIEAVETEIASTEKILATRQETFELRDAAYQEAKQAYRQLKEMGPSLIAQTKALKEAQEERTRAIEQTAGDADTDSKVILQELTSALEDAQSDHRAAELIAEDEKSGISLDEIIAAEEKAAASDETVAGWIY
jgi:hypothetical protein